MVSNEQAPKIAIEGRSKIHPLHRKEADYDSVEATPGLKVQTQDPFAAQRADGGPFLSNDQDEITPLSKSPTGNEVLDRKLSSDEWGNLLLPIVSLFNSGDLWKLLLICDSG